MKRSILVILSAIMLLVVGIFVSKALLKANASPAPHLKESGSDDPKRLEKLGKLPLESDENNLCSIQFINEQEGWISIDEKLWRTKNRGENWQLVYNASSDSIQKFQFINSQTGWLIASGKMFKTDDGGETWGPFAQPIPSNYDGDLLCFQFLKDGKQGWVAGGFLHKISRAERKQGKIPTRYTSSDGARAFRGAIFHTTDGGKNWQQQLECSNWGYIGELFMPDAEHGWAVGTSGTYRFENDKWESTRSLPGNNQSPSLNSLDVAIGMPSWEPCNIFFVNKDVGWLSNSNGYLGKSTDGGKTWKDVSRVTNHENKGLPNYLLNLYFGDLEVGWAIDSDGNFHETKDGGLSWIKVDLGTKLLGVYFLDPQHGYAAARGWLFRISL